VKDIFDGIENGHGAFPGLRSPLDGGDGNARHGEVKLAELPQDIRIVIITVFCMFDAAQKNIFQPSLERQPILAGRRLDMKMIEYVADRSIFQAQAIEKRRQVAAVFHQQDLFAPFPGRQDFL